MLATQAKVKREPWAGQPPGCSAAVGLVTARSISLATQAKIDTPANAQAREHAFFLLATQG